MDLGLKDKVVVVTGASKGIGLATARLLLQEGAKVAICSVTESHLREAEQELSRLGAVYAEVVDMTQEQSVYAFADHVVERVLGDRNLEQRLLRVGSHQLRHPGGAQG